jgi:hypothetical protein
MEYVEWQNLPNGTANPLLAQLRAAYRTTDAHVSCVKMRDFINTVVKDGIGEITSTAYSYMTGDASEIMGAMGCSPEVVSQQRVR